jgi:hypothetical protein
MRFSAVHKTASYLLIAAAFAALALSRELPSLLLAITAVIIVASWWAEPSRFGFMRHRAWTLTWNVATVLAFALSVLDAISGEFLTAGMRFLLLLLVNKLWNRRASRDYLQAYAVSFLMLVAGAALSTDLWYALCFLAYVIFATWTLTLFHLRREMEENYLVKHSDRAQSEPVEVQRILNSRRVVGGSFLLGTSVVSLCVFLSSTLAFFLIPRVGFGFFVSKQKRGQATTGFSDRLELGQYGLIKDNPTVVMRVELPGGQVRAPLRFRGVTFDRYEHGRWSRTAQVPPASLRNHGELTVVGDWASRTIDRTKLRSAIDQARVQRIYLEPLDTPVLFAAPTPVAFALDRPTTPTAPLMRLEARGPAEIVPVESRIDPSTGRSTTVERRGPMRYSVWSDERQPSVPALLAARWPDDTAPASLRPYLQIPDEKPPRVLPWTWLASLASDIPERTLGWAAFAHHITRGKEGPFSQAFAVEQYLQKNLRYTLDLTRDERYEPIDDFLFVHARRPLRVFRLVDGHVGALARYPGAHGQRVRRRRLECLRPISRHSPRRRALMGRGLPARRWLGDLRSDAGRPGHRRDAQLVRRCSPIRRHPRDDLAQVGHRVRPRQTSRRGLDSAEILRWR